MYIYSFMCFCACLSMSILCTLVFNFWILDLVAAIWFPKIRSEPSDQSDGSDPIWIWAQLFCLSLFFSTVLLTEPPQYCYYTSLFPLKFSFYMLILATFMNFVQINFTIFFFLSYSLLVDLIFITCILSQIFFIMHLFFI